MVAVVALIAGIGVLLLTIKVAVPQLRPNLALRPSEEDDSGKDVRYYDSVYIILKTNMSSRLL